MTDTSSDGHSPATCNFRACNAPDATGPCPFVADEKPLVVDYSQPVECRHDWRQLVDWLPAKDPHLDEPTFYCTHCLTITTPSKT